MTDNPVPPNSTIIEDKNGTLLIWEPGIAQTLLQKGIKVKLNKGNKTINCRVSDWYYEATSHAAPRLHIVVDVLRDPIFETLNSEVQDFLRFLIAVAILLVLGLVAYVVYVSFGNPVLSWGFIGYYIRWIVLIAILVVGLTVAGRTKGYIQNKTVKGQTLGLIYTALTLVMMGAWWYISTPPNELVTYPNDYAQYVNHLGQQFKQSIILPLISASWLAGLFKLIGYTGLAGFIELVVGVFKKKE